MHSNPSRKLLSAILSWYISILVPPTEFRVDASPFGLGAILTQSYGDETRSVAYASRTLTQVEKPYSQTERWALAVVGKQPMGQFLTSIQITSPSKLSTTRHRNRQHVLNSEAFARDRIHFVRNIHPEVITLRMYFLVCYFVMQQPLLATRLKNIFSMSSRMQLLQPCPSGE